MTTLPHTRDRDTATEMQQTLYSFIKISFQAIRQGMQTIGFLTKHCCRYRRKFLLFHTYL